MIGYIARDGSGSLYVHYTLPVRCDDTQWWWSDDDAFEVKSEVFPEFNNLSYNDDPVKVEINIKRI